MISFRADSDCGNLSTLTLSFDPSFHIVIMAGASSSRGWKCPCEDDLTYRSFVSPRAEDMYNLYMRRGHLMVERNILVGDFPFIGLTEQFSQRGWLGLCSGHDYGHPIMVAEFLANRVEVHLDFFSFSSVVRGIRVNFSAETIRDFLDIPNVHNPQYPFIPQPKSFVCCCFDYRGHLTYRTMYFYFWSQSLKT